MADQTWKQGMLTIPGIGVALLPKLICPVCWPLYAGIVSSLGLGFFVSSTYLLPVTLVFLILTLTVLAFRAKQRRGYGPLLLGSAASAMVLIVKFQFESRPATYSGVAVLLAAAVWNAWPKKVVESCSCDSRIAGIAGAKR